MRPIRVDITGTTDKNGNFSQVVRLDKTDEWRNIKVAIGTVGPAEWSLSTANTPLTYGRGRRVTLGPELLYPFDTLTVACTGGPVSATVTGSATGTSGTEEEVIPTYAPSPNTIALDAAIPRQKMYPDGTAVATINAGGPSFSVAPGFLSAVQTFTLPAGTVAIRLLASSSGNPFLYSLLMVGSQTTEQYYGDPLTPGNTFLVAIPTLPFTVPIERDWDSQVKISVLADSTNVANVDFSISALFAPESPGQAGAAQSIFIPVAAPWQAPQHFTAQNISINSGATFLFIPATGTEKTYLHGYAYGTDGVNAAGRIIVMESATTNPFLDLDANATRGQIAVGTGSGAPTLASQGISVKNSGGAASFIAMSQAYSQA